MLAPELYSIKDITRPDPKLLWLYLLRTLSLCLLGPWFIVAIIPFYFKYQTLTYRFDDEGVSMSWGVLWRREIHLTYARIQDIHLSRGLFERWLGLATIQVQTASGNAGAEMSIVGLAEFDVVRDFLYSRMRGAELGEPGLAGPSDPKLQALQQILSELEALRLALGKSVAPGRGGPGASA